MALGQRNLSHHCFLTTLRCIDCTDKFLLQNAAIRIVQWNSIPFYNSSEILLLNSSTKPGKSTLRQDPRQTYISNEEVSTSVSHCDAFLCFLPQMFQGNSNQSTVVSNKLPQPILLQYIRVYPVDWYMGVCLRLEVYGCAVGVSTPFKPTAPRAPVICPEFRSIWIAA